MHYLFAGPEQVLGDGIWIMGPDVNHMKNVLRMKPGEQVLISDGTRKDYICSIISINSEAVEAGIRSVSNEGWELPSRIWLLQGLPKSDKVDLIIQKVVELGASRIVPVATKSTMVKLDSKKEVAKVGRWQATTENAVKQSKRSVVPAVTGVVSLAEAFEHAQQERFGACLTPYEQESGMEGGRKEFARIGSGQDIAVFIGPKGSFDECGIRQVLEIGVRPVNLGKRILRTEMAGLAMLLVVMMRLEGAL